MQRMPARVLEGRTEGACTLLSRGKCQCLTVQKAWGGSRVCSLEETTKAPAASLKTGNTAGTESTRTHGRNNNNVGRAHGGAGSHTAGAAAALAGRLLAVLLLGQSFVVELL